MKHKGIMLIIVLIFLFGLMFMAFMGINVLVEESNLSKTGAAVMSGGVIVILLIGYRKEIKTLF